MNKLIKISKQSAKILGNYVECKFHEFHSSNILSHTRFIPKCISNKVTLSDYIEMHSTIDLESHQEQNKRHKNYKS